MASYESLLGTDKTSNNVEQVVKAAYHGRVDILFVPSGVQCWGDFDSANFRSAYPDKVGTKLDSCALCHSGSPEGEKPVQGSCQYCHAVTKYGAESTAENLLKTLNPYGVDYKNHGRNVDAFQAIANTDSDLDLYNNAVEIAAIRYPGDPKDDPSKVPAPYRVFTREQLERMPQHSQFLLMNASKSDDAYTTYGGVALEDFIKSMMLDSATGITVYSPDGFATYHPFTPSTEINTYHVFGVYPPGIFYYDVRADMAKNPLTGWCNYSSPSAAGRVNGSPIINPQGLKMLLAFERDGGYLAPGVLNKQNKLDGEGPFRVVPPQKNPGPPDQRSTATDAKNPAVWVWPYKNDADHNAGFSSRTVTIIQVGPLPEGTTDVDTLEAGWNFVDEAKILVYGAIDPLPTILEKLSNLEGTLEAIEGRYFKNPSSQRVLMQKVEVVQKQIQHGAYWDSMDKLQEDLMSKTDGCVAKGSPDKNDWVTDCAAQKQLYWGLNEILVLLKIIG